MIFALLKAKARRGLFASLNANILNRRRGVFSRGVRSHQGQGGEGNQVEPIEVASSLSAIWRRGVQREGKGGEGTRSPPPSLPIKGRGDQVMANTSSPLAGGNEDPEWLTMPPNEAWFKAKQGDKDAQFIMGKG